MSPNCSSWLSPNSSSSSSSRLSRRSAPISSRRALSLVVSGPVILFPQFAVLKFPPLPNAHRDQADPRQSFRTHLEGNQSLARHATGRPLRLHVHAKTRLLAQSHRGLLLQVCPLRPASHPSDVKART